MDQLSAALSRNLKALRAQRHLTQDGLAEVIDLSTNMIAAIEAGRAWPSKPTILKIAKGLDVEPIRLFISREDIRECITASDLPEDMVLQRVAEALGLKVDFK